MHIVFIIFSVSTRLLATTTTGHREREQDHSYLSYQHDVVLGLEEVKRSTVSSTPSYMYFVSCTGRRIYSTWREEARSSTPPDLVPLCIDWGLAHVFHVSGGYAVHLSRQ